MFYPLQPQVLQHARLPCGFLSPGVCPSRCPFNWWFNPTISLFVWGNLVQFSSVVQSCPTLGDTMGCSMPGFSVHHQLPQLAQIHVHQIGDAIRPSHPLCSLLLPSVFPSLRFFSNELALCIRWTKYWCFNYSISPSNEYSGLISQLGLTRSQSFQHKGFSRVFSNTTVQKHQF